MEAILVFSLLVLIFLITWQLYFKSSKKTQSYPGPGILESILGLIKSKDNLHLLFWEWTEKYGKFFTVFIGPDRYFILSDADLVKEVFSSSKCAARPEVPPLDPFFKGSKGIIGTNAQPWTDHRNFSISTLRTLGFGNDKHQMNKLISEEILLVLHSFEEGQGKPIVINKEFMVPSFNALWIAIANKKFCRTQDAKAIGMFKSHLALLQEVTQNPLIVFSQTIAKLVPWLPPWKKFRNSYIHLAKYLDGVIDEHRATMVKGQPRDYIDYYLETADRTTDKDSVFYEATNLKNCLFEFFYVGSLNASSTMEWIILHMIRNPTVQQKVHEELRRVVGPHRLPVLADRSNLPYLQATLHEVFRLTPTAATGIPHQVLEDFKLNNHTLPKGSRIFSNTYFIQRNPSVWESPDEFLPQRFLTKEGQFKAPSENFLPFSVGLRTCIGRGLATDFLFLLTAGIFHKFKLENPPGLPIPTLDSAGGVALTAKSFSVLVTKV